MQLGGMKQEALAQEAGDGSSAVGLHRPGVSQLLNFLGP